MTTAQDDTSTPPNPLPRYQQWCEPLHRFVPIVAGGDGPVENDGQADDADTGDGDTDDQDTAQDDTSSDDESPQKVDWSDDAAKWKELARRHEKAGKALKARITELEKAAMTDSEKAIADAKDAGRAEARAEVGQILAQAKLEAALAKVVDDPSEIVEDLNLAAYVTDDGEVDTDKVEKLQAKYAALLKPGKPTGSADGGPRGTSKPGQLTRDDIKTMTPAEITKAKADGRLNDLLGIKN